MFHKYFEVSNPCPMMKETCTSHELLRCVDTKAFWAIMAPLEAIGIFMSFLIGFAWEARDLACPLYMLERDRKICAVNL